MAILPGCEPFSSDGGKIGVIVCHGFTGSPAGMRPWAEHLAAAGYTVRLPLLPGHGTRWQDANRTRWRDWYATVERAYDELAERCETVFGCGLSAGGTLVTRLAEEKGDKVAGLVLVNPAYGTQRFDAKFARYIGWAAKSFPGIINDIKKPGADELGYPRFPVPAFASLQQLWKITVADLPRVTAPILMFRSTVDHVVDPLSAELLKAGATSTTVREVMLENSYHVATLDNDAPLIFEGSVEFIRSVTDSAVGTSPS